MTNARIPLGSIARSKTPVILALSYCFVGDARAVQHLYFGKDRSRALPHRRCSADVAS